ILGLYRTPIHPEAAMEPLRRGLSMLCVETLQNCLNAHKAPFSPTDCKERLKQLCAEKIIELGVNDLVTRFEQKCFTTFSKAYDVADNQPSKLTAAIAKGFPVSLETCNYSLRSTIARYLEIE